MKSHEKPEVPNVAMAEEMEVCLKCGCEFSRAVDLPVATCPRCQMLVEMLVEKAGEEEALC